MTLLTIMRFIAIMIAALFFAGCQKKSDTSSPVTQPPSAAAPAANSQGTASITTPPSAGANANTNVAPDFGELNRLARIWALQHQRPPKDFEEFAATANVSIPPPPPGKKYAFDSHMHVILVNVKP